MKYIYNLLLFATLFFGMLASAVAQQTDFTYETPQPLHEVRAVWLTTIGGLDWPRIKANDAAGIQRQKAELCRILDGYKRININTVIFQTRVRASVLYPSKIEPWEMCLTGYPNKNPGYDPLQFAIEECHKRGMELHAWVVCIPIGTADRQKKYGAASIVKKKPSLIKTVGGECFMIPGNPETADYIANICREIVQNYDVDGISLDYIRYPEAVYRFSDENLCPKGANKAEWKRANITRIVRKVHDAVKPLKPWVKLSSSPIGKYRDLARYSAKGWNCFDAVWQDPQAWLRDNIQDMLFPMMYFQGDHYYPFLFNWRENTYGHPIAPGLGIYFLDPREGKWQLNEVRAEMYTARNSGIGGMAFYRGEFLTNNSKGLFDACEQEFFPYPALVPPMTWMGQKSSPTAPKHLAYNEGKLTWQGDAPYYNVYGSNTYPVDCSKAENLLFGRHEGTTFQIGGRALKMHYFAVTSSDRFGNESEPTQEYYDGVVFHDNLDVTYLINRDKKGSRKIVVNSKAEEKARAKAAKEAAKAEKARAKAEKAARIKAEKAAAKTAAKELSKDAKNEKTVSVPKVVDSKSSSVKSAATYKPKHKTYTRTIKVKKK